MQIRSEYEANAIMTPKDQPTSWLHASPNRQNENTDSSDAPDSVMIGALTIACSCIAICVGIIISWII